jgi:hypothetical protein
MKILLVLLSIIGVSSAASKAEKLKVDYELVLNRCKGDSCHSESAAHGRVYVSLEEEDPTFAVGYTPVEEKVGGVAYQLRFHLSRESNGKKIKRYLTIGFSARKGTLTGKQVSWSEKSFSGSNWQAFTMTSTSGDAYSEEQEIITPILQILQVTSMP